MARATLEMFLKLTGADKTSRGLDKVSNSSKKLDSNVKNSSKSNAQFAAGMSGFGKAAIVGASIAAGKALINFAADALEAAVSAEEAGAAFGTTYGDAAQKAGQFTEQFANKAGLTNSELQQLLSTLGAVAQGIGFTQSESADLGIELTKIAADVASFSNISAGAEPVLKAFQSALTGEREALKTYGIAISEAEVQTKAFQMTGKANAESLTRQEKAYATLALIQEKAAVQIGDLDRTSESFANQQRAVSAEVRQLKEDIGAELIPAAAEMLPIFREFVEDIAPPLINAFKETAYFIADVGLAIDYVATKVEAFGNKFPKTNEALEKFFGFLTKQSGLYKIIDIIGDTADKQRELEDETNKTAETIAVYKQYSDGVTKSMQKNKNLVNLSIPTYKKFGTTIKKDVLPFAEKLAGVLGLSAAQIENLTDLQKDRDDAQTDLNRALEEEGLITAQEALRKKELQQQIAELTFFQGQGKNVTEELAVAQEELRLIELALTRESDQLVEARKRAVEAQQDLDEATGKGTSAIETQIEAANNLQGVMDFFNTENFRDELILAADTLNFNWKEALDGALNEYLKFRQQVTGKSITTEVDEFLKALDEQGLLPGGFTPSTMADPVETPADTVGDNSNVKSGNNGGGEQTVIIPVYIGDEKVDEVIAKSTNRQSAQGKTLSIK
jgi:hypothetical protein